MRKMQSASMKPDLQAIFVDQFRNLAAAFCKSIAMVQSFSKRIGAAYSDQLRIWGSIEFARRDSHGQSVSIKADLELQKEGMINSLTHAGKSSISFN